MFSGSIVALVTPMSETGQVDFDALQRLVRWHIDSGTDALVVLGTTGESASVTAEERLAIINTVIAENKGAIPIIVGAGTNNTATTIALSQQAKALGADAVLLVAPYYLRPCQEGLYQHFKCVAEAINLPIMLYNVPSRTSCDLSVETVLRLADLEQVVAIKDATGQLARISEFREAKPDFAVLSGDDATAVAAMLMGAKGVVTVIGNILPKETAELCEAAQAGDVALARTKEAAIYPVLQQLSALPNPVAIKWMMAETGLIPQGIRLPLVALAPEKHEGVRQALGLLDN